MFWQPPSTCYLYIVLTTCWHYFIAYLFGLHFLLASSSISLFPRAVIIIWSQVREPARLLCSRAVCFTLEVMELFALLITGCIKLCCKTWNMPHQGLLEFGGLVFLFCPQFLSSVLPHLSREQQVIWQDSKLVFSLWLSWFMKKSFFCLESFTGRLYLQWSWDLSQGSSVNTQLS